MFPGFLPKFAGKGRAGWAARRPGLKREPSGNSVGVNRLDQLAARIATRQHGVFSTTQLTPVTDAEVQTRLSTGRWRRVQRQIYVVEGSPDTWEQQIWIKLLAGGPGAVVGLRSAAALHGLRGMHRIATDVVQPEETVPNAKPRTSRRTTRLPSSHVTVIEGFPVTTIERTLFDLAGITSQWRRRSGRSYLTEARVERLVENALSQKLVTVGSLRQVHLSLAGRGRAGSRLMRQLLDERSGTYVATESELEDAFLALVDEFGLPAPSRQVHLGNAAEHIGRVDFHYEHARLVVEADSQAFHGQRTQMIHDHQRDLQLLAGGWQVLRIDWWQLTEDRVRVAGLLRQILERRTAPVPP